MNVEGVDGYLTALAAGPRRAAALKGAEWLPRIWGGGRCPMRRPSPARSSARRRWVWVLRHLHAIDRALAGKPARLATDCQRRRNRRRRAGRRRRLVHRLPAGRGHRPRGPGPRSSTTPNWPETGTDRRAGRRRRAPSPMPPNAMPCRVRRWTPCRRCGPDEQRVPGPGRARPATGRAPARRCAAAAGVLHRRRQLFPIGVGPESRCWRESPPA